MPRSSGASCGNKATKAKAKPSPWRGLSGGSATRPRPPTPLGILPFPPTRVPTPWCGGYCVRNAVRPPAFFPRRSTFVSRQLPEYTVDVTDLTLRVIGRVESPLTDLASAPRQADEGGPAAWLVFEPEMVEGLRSIRPGDELILLTWLDRSRRDLLTAQPGGRFPGPRRGSSAHGRLIARTLSACTAWRSWRSTAGGCGYGS